MASSTDRYQILIEVDERGAVTGMQRVGQGLQGLDDRATGAKRSLETMTGMLSASAIESGARAIFGFLRDSSAAAAEEDAVMRSLRGTVENLGVSWGAASGPLQQLFSSIQNTTRYADDEAAGAFQSLIGITQSYAASTTGLAAAVDLAAGMNMDLGASAELVGKFVAGNVGVLGRYGIILDESEKKTLQLADAEERAAFLAEEMGERFGGIAQAQLQEADGQIVLFSHHIDDLQESIGRTINREVFDPAIIGPMIEAVDFLTAHVGSLVAGFQMVVVGVETAVAATVMNITRAVSVVANAVLPVIRTIASVMPGMDEDAVAAAAEEVAGFISSIADDAASTTEELAERMQVLLDRFNGVGEAAADATGPVRQLTGGMSEQSAKAVELAGKLAMLDAQAQSVLEQYQSWDRANDEFIGSSGELGDATQDLTGYVEDLDEAVMQMAADWAENHTLPTFEWFGPPQLPSEWEQLRQDVEVLLADAVYAGFQGGFEDVGDLLEDLAGQWSGRLAQGLSNAIDEGGITGPGGALSYLAANPGEAILGGVGGLYGASQQQSRTAGAVMGLTSGFSLGAGIGSIIPVIGTAVGGIVGAIVGGAIGYFTSGGQESPETQWRLGPGGASVATRGGQGMTAEDWEMWERQAQSLYRAERMQYIDTLQMLGQADLFGMLGALPSTGSGAGQWQEGSAASILRQLGETVLPDLFESWAGQAIGTGLGNLGVSDQAISALWDQLGDLTGQDRVQALQTYIQAVVHSAELLEDLDPAEVERVLSQSPLEALGDQVTEMFEGFDVAFASVQGLDYADLAPQADEVFTTIQSALGTWLSMIRQIDAEEQAMHRSIAAQRESIAVAGMDTEEQASYYQSQIQSLMEQLRSGEGDPSQLVGDIQRYVAAWQQIAGDELWAQYDFQMGEMGGPGSQMWAGQYDTLAEYLDAILGETETLATGRYAESRDQIMDYVDQAAAEVDRWRELLGIAGTSLEDLIEDLRDAGESGDTALDQPPGGGRKPGSDDVGWEDPEASGGGKALARASQRLAEAMSALPIQVNITLSGSSQWLRGIIQAEIAVADRAGRAHATRPGSIS